MQNIDSLTLYNIQSLLDNCTHTLHTSTNYSVINLIKMKRTWVRHIAFAT